MTCESIGSFDSDGECCGPPPPSTFSHYFGDEEFHQFIIAQPTFSSKRDFYITHPSLVACPVAQLFDKSILCVNSRPSREGNGHLDIGIKGGLSWGDSNGPSFDISGHMTYQDNRGNYLETELEHNSNGQGRLSVSAGHHDKGEPAHSR